MANEPNEIKLEIIQGSDYEQEFNYADENGATIDLSAYEGVAVFKDTYDGDALLTIDAADFTLGSTSPNIKLKFNATDTSALQDVAGVYDVLLKKPNGKFERAFQGKWTLNRQVTPLF